MKRMLGVLVAGAALLFAPAGEAAGPAVPRQKIEITLHPEDGSLTGKTVITASGTPALRLFLAPTARVDSVLVGGQEIPFATDATGITVPLPGGSGQVTVCYSALFSTPLPAFRSGTEDPTYGVAAVITPGGVYLGAGSGWYPETEEVPARREILVHAPAGFAAVTEGALVRRDDTPGGAVSAWETDRPLGPLELSAGRYTLYQRQGAVTALQAWLLSPDQLLADSYLAASNRYIAFYSGLLSPYPFPKFAVVENFVPTGYGFPSYTLIGGNVLRLPFLLATSLPHEIVHNWWGNGVLVDYRTGNWSEGITVYLADHLQEEQKSPAAARGYRMKLLADYATLVPPDQDFPLSRFTSRSDPASRSIGYGKGAMAFHTVRKIKGDDPFYAALRSIVANKLFHTASWDDFAAAFGGTSGEFLREFVATTGAMEIKLDDLSLRRTPVGYEVSGKISRDGVKAKVPVVLALRAGEKEIGRQTFAVGAGVTAFTLAAAELPDRIAIDPDVDLFRKLSEREIPYTVNRIKGSGEVAAVRGPDCRAGGEALRTLLDSLGKKGVPILAEEKVTAAELAGKDLVVCGAKGAELLPELPQGVARQAGSFTVDGKSYGGDDATLVAVGPRRGGAATLLYQPPTEEAGRDVAPRVTHYGGYGYLVFRQGKNLAKGLASPADAGTVRLPPPS